MGKGGWCQFISYFALAQKPSACFGPATLGFHPFNAVILSTSLAALCPFTVCIFWTQSEDARATDRGFQSCPLSGPAYPGWW